MRRSASFRLSRRQRLLDSFTLVELLTAMAIIAILSALTLAAASGVWAHAARSRAASEISGMGSALDSYKIDNGVYPTASTMTTNTYGTYDGSGTSTNYSYSSQVLFQALTSKIDYEDTTNSTTFPATGKSYMTFKTTQLGNYKAVTGTTGAGSTYVQDPWGYAYGYSTGDTNSPQTTPPYNGGGFYDLWSTGGLVQPQATNINAWVTDWK